MNKVSARIAGAVMMCTMVAAPITANAQSSSYRHRQQTKNTWRNLGYAGGALGVYGLLKGDRNLAILGLGGGAYSAWRYEQDRKSQRRMRDRALRFYRRRH
jgi:hypothetical protein